VPNYVGQVGQVPCPFEVSALTKVFTNSDYIGLAALVTNSNNSGKNELMAFSVKVIGTDVITDIYQLVVV
jgi:hypothetical protein